MKRTTIVLAMFLIVLTAQAGILKRLIEVFTGPDVVLHFPVLERRWVPDPKHQNCGTLYILAEGNEQGFTRYTDTFTLVKGVPTDSRFKHTACSAAWWTPPKSPSNTLCRATADESAAPAGDPCDYEFVVSSTSNRVFYEQRTIPHADRKKQNNKIKPKK